METNTPMESRAPAVPWQIRDLIWASSLILVAIVAINVVYLLASRAFHSLARPSGEALTLFVLAQDSIMLVALWRFSLARYHVGWAALGLRGFGAGAVERIIYGGGSLDRFGRLAWVNRGIEEGTLIAEEYSSLSIAFRYLAGSLGLLFIPIRSFVASDLIKRLQEQDASHIAAITDPFTGDQWLALKSLLPEASIVQAQIADGEGNAWIFGPRWGTTRNRSGQASA